MVGTLDAHANRRRLGVGARTDEQRARKDGFREHKFVEDCISAVVREAFTATLVVKSEKKAKKKGALFLAVCMIRSYFGMNTLRQATLIVNNVTKMILTGKTKLTNFPKSHSVPYQYYAGRLQIVAGRYDEAEEMLMSALRNCPIDVQTNRRQILRVLIPTKMARGVLPTPTLLQEYNLKQFQDISIAVRSGNVCLYVVWIRVSFSSFALTHFISQENHSNTNTQTTQVQ